MNIFVLDNDTRTCAAYHNDKHTVKMILEYAQLLSAAHHLTESPLAPLCYKLTHKAHPCTKWVLESRANYEWLYELFLALCCEYTQRYNKIHKTLLKLGDILGHPPTHLPRVPMTPFAQAMPPEYYNDDPVRAYRDYYMGAKRKIAQWKTCKPEWYTV